MRFASHRDIARAVERGVRKAGLPVAYSAGFSPHPRISYSPGAPTGAASEAEYLELSLTGLCAVAEVRERLDAALPDGIDVLAVAELGDRSDGPRLEASEWEVVLPGVGPAEAAAAVRTFLAAPSAEIDRLTSKGTRRLDARAAVVTMWLDQRAGADQHCECAILRMVVRQLTPAVRPNDILAALRHLAALEPSSPARVTRLAQGPLDGEAASGTGTPRSSRAAESGWPAGHDAHASRRVVRGTAKEQVKERAWMRGSAAQADTSPGNAQDQLPRGAAGPDAGPRAREPDGRDSPNARNRATERRTRQ